MKYKETVYKEKETVYRNYYLNHSTDWERPNYWSRPEVEVCTRKVLEDDLSVFIEFTKGKDYRMEWEMLCEKIDELGDSNGVNTEADFEW